jgi:regulator of cell morphogenesis and NO signaling
MDTLQFAGTESDVVNKRYYDTEISKKIRTGVESAGKSNFEIYVKEEGLKKLLQPFNVFKTISRDDFEKWDIDFLVEYLKTHHGFTRKNAAVIYELAQKVFYGHCENHPELIILTEVMVLFLHDLLNQIRKQEFFFAYIRQISKTKRHLQTPGNADLKVVNDTIKLLRNDQEKSLNYLKVIRQITGNYRIPSDACQSYKSLFEKLKVFEEDLIFHFHLEKNILFQKQQRLLEKKQSKIKMRKS